MDLLDSADPAAPSDHVALQRYMGRAGAAWAEWQVLKEQARDGKRVFNCKVEARYLEVSISELEDISSDSNQLNGEVDRDVDGFFGGLREVAERCRDDDRGKRDGYMASFEQIEPLWRTARRTALRLGWDGPCALHNSVAACWVR